MQIHNTIAWTNVWISMFNLTTLKSFHKQKYAKLYFDYISRFQWRNRFLQYNDFFFIIWLKSINGLPFGSFLISYSGTICWTGLFSIDKSLFCPECMSEIWDPMTTFALLTCPSLPADIKRTPTCFYVGYYLCRKYRGVPKVKII